MASLHDKIISGIFWTFLQKVGSRGIGLITTIILARILTPRDFGLIGMLTIFIAVSQALVQAGFNQALIQKENTDEEDYSSVFYINLIASVFLYSILFFTAPLIARFYGQPVLTNLTRILALGFVINAFSYVQEAKLTKEMRFKTLMFVHLPSTVISGLVAIAMAFTGFGVWSIVWQQLVMRLAYAIQIWIYAKWRPLFAFNRRKANRLFSFGGKLMIATIIQSVFDNIYLVVIGKFFPVTTLGYYQNSKKLVDAPTRTISSVLGTVTLPAFSLVQSENEKLRIGYKRGSQQLVFLLAPILILASVLAEPLFSFVLTDKWLPAVPFFQLLCVVGFFSPLNAYCINIIKAKGRSDIVLKLQIIKKVVIAGIIIITVPFGIWALVASQIVNIIFSYTLNCIYINKLLKYSIFEQLSDIFPAFLASIIIGAIVFFIDTSINGQTDWMRLLVGIVTGLIIYLFISWKISFPSFEDFKTIFKAKISMTRKR